VPAAKLSGAAAAAFYPARAAHFGPLSPATAVYQIVSRTANFGVPARTAANNQDTEIEGRIKILNDFNGVNSASQASDEGSIPFTRSSKIKG
jgi:hypothetical protein